MKLREGFHDLLLFGGKHTGGDRAAHVRALIGGQDPTAAHKAVRSKFSAPTPGGTFPRPNLIRALTVRTACV